MWIPRLTTLVHEPFAQRSPHPPTLSTHVAPSARFLSVLHNARRTTSARHSNSGRRTWPTWLHQLATLVREALAPCSAHIVVLGTPTALGALDSRGSLGSLPWCMSLLNGARHFNPHSTRGSLCSKEARVPCSACNTDPPDPTNAQDHPPLA